MQYNNLQTYENSFPLTPSRGGEEVGEKLNKIRYNKAV